MASCSSSSSSSRQCGICDKQVDFVHFGGLSCRACAAFFRRKIAEKQVPIRRCNGKCVLNNEHLRRVCQSCRFDKCLEIGMKPSLVLSRSSVATADISTKGQPKSLLEQLRNAYENLQMARRQEFHLEENHTPKLCNYKVMNKVTSKDNGLIIEHFLPFFHNQEGMHESYKSIFFPHFMTPFILLETAFKSADSDFIIMPNEDFVDVNQLEKLYENPDGLDNNVQRNAKLLFEPYWRLNKQSLKDNLKDVKLDQPEFLFLTALIYWDNGLQNQTDDCIEFCTRKRSEIIEELTHYEKTTRRDNDYCLRIAEVLVVLQAVQRAFSLMMETREISMIYDLYDAHCQLFELMNI